jgi:hypothetical protein
MMNIESERVYVDGYYHDLDVLCGRGGVRSNRHQGNQWYLALVEVHKVFYRGATTNETKRIIGNDILQTIREQGGRILEQVTSTQRWYLARHERAHHLVIRALRG